MPVYPLIFAFSGIFSDRQGKISAMFFWSENAEGTVFSALFCPVAWVVA